MARKKKPAPAPLATFDDLDAAGLGAGYRPTFTAPAEETATTEPAKRGFLGAANDTVIEIANAAAGGVKAAADFVVPGNAVSDTLGRFIEHGEQSQSDVVKAEKQKFRSEVAAANGIGDELLAVGRYVTSNPLLTAAQAAGSFALPAGAVKGAGAAATALGAGAKGASAAGRAGGVAAGGAMAGGDAGGSAFDLVMQAPIETLLQNPMAQELAARGADEATIRQTLATAAARDASLLPAIIGAAGGAFGAERLLAGGARKAGARGFVAATASEALQEGVEEGVTHYEGQRAAGQFVPGIDPSKGVAAAAGLGAVLGGGTGGAVQLMTSQPEPAPVKGPLTRAANSAPVAAAAGIAPEPAPQEAPPPDPMVERIKKLPAGDREEALAAYNLLARDDLPKGVRQYNSRLLDSLLDKQEPAEEPSRVEPSDPAALLSNTMGRDPLQGALQDRQDERNALTNLDNWMARAKPLPLEKAQDIQAAATERGLQFEVVPHGAGQGYTVVPAAWITPQMRNQTAAALPLDTQPTGVLRADARGNVVPETGAQAIDSRNAAKAQAAERQRKNELGLTPDVEAVQRGAKRPPKPTVQAGDVLNKQGKPFTTKGAAVRAQKKAPGDLLEVDGGWVVRPQGAAAQEATNVSDATAAGAVDPGDAGQLGADGQPGGAPAAAVGTDAGGDVRADAARPDGSQQDQPVPAGAQEPAAVVGESSPPTLEGNSPGLPAKPPKDATAPQGERWAAADAPAREKVLLAAGWKTGSPGLEKMKAQSWEKMTQGQRNRIAKALPDAQNTPAEAKAEAASGNGLGEPGRPLEATNSAAGAAPVAPGSEEPSGVPQQSKPESEPKPQESPPNGGDAETVKKGRTAKPRMAETADDLWAAIRDTAGGVVHEGRVIVPMLRVVAGDDFKLNAAGKLEVVDKKAGGMAVRDATDSEADEFHKDLSEDRVRVLLLSAPGYGSGYKQQQVLKELHSPSGNGFAAKPQEEPSAAVPARAEGEAGKAEETPPAGADAAAAAETGAEAGAAAEVEAAGLKGKKREPVAAKTATPKTIEDTGEKIGGARKDRWKERGLAVADLDEMSDTEGAELAVKKNVWTPDYEAIAKDAEPVTAAMVKVVYDSLAAKPKQDTPQGRRDYVKAMQAVRKVYGAVKSVEEAKSAYLKLREDLGVAPSRGMDGSRALGANADGRRVMFSVYKGRSDPFVFDYNALARAKALVKDGFPTIEPWKRRLTVRGFDGKNVTPAGVRIYLESSAEVGTPLTKEQIGGTFWRISDLKGKVLGYATTKEDAEAAAKTIYERDFKGGKDGKPEPERPHLDELTRKGLPERIDRDVTAQDFIQAFGFRGVEFGNWSAQDERQRILNMAYDGLADLAEIMGVPPKAMSLNGTLGMAFGARGGGRFAAHYEPGKLVINMTKLRGGGSMAHEWAHALDHYFGELDQADGYKGRARGASGWYEQAAYTGKPLNRMEKDASGKWVTVTKMRLANLRPEMSQAFDRLMSALFSGHITKAEMIREIEAGIERTQAMADAMDDPKLKKVYLDSVTSQKQNLEETRAEPDDTVYARGKSEYAKEAAKLSGKSESGYWSRPTEMFARAFESWVFDRVVAMGARSDYLVHGVEESRFAGGDYKGNPYPVGKERAAINAAFDRLAKTIKTKPTDNGVAMFARTPGTKKAYEARIDQLFAGEKARTGTKVLDRSDLMGLLGYPDAPLVLNESHLREGMALHPEMTAEIWKKVPDWLEDPAAAYRNESMGHKGRIVVLAPETVAGYPVLMVIEPQASVPGRTGEKQQLLVTAFAKTTGTVPLAAAARAGRLLYLSKENAQQVGRDGGVQFPTHGDQSAGRTKILAEKHLAAYRREAAGDASAVGDSPFARTPTAEAVRSLSVEKLQDFADAIAMKWANAPEIVVVQSMQDPRVPEEARNDDAAQRSQGASGQPAGFYYGPDRSVYLVASEIHSAEEALTVLLHESAGHFGLRGTFGDAGLLPILKQMVALRPKEVAAKAWAYGLVPDGVSEDATPRQVLNAMSEQDRLHAAEEVLAEMAQDTPTLGYVRRAVAAIRTFLRDVLGLKIKLSDDEIARNWIIPAREWVVRGREAAKQRPAATASTPAVAFSRGAASNTLGTRPLRQQAMQTLHDTFSAPGKLSWWHKTVGTQYNLAQRSPQFKRVFDSVQDFLHDVSRYATEAADMAPKILPKLETWRDITKSPISAEDNKAVATPVFEGTMIWTRVGGEPVKVDELRERSLTMTDEQKQRDLLRAGLSENVIKMWQGLPLEQYQRTLQTAYENRILRPGIVWTDEELAGMFKLTPEQIGLYKEFRAAVDNSLTHLAVSDMVRFGGKDVEAVRQEALDAGDVEAAALILRDHLLELATKQPDRNEVLIDTAEKMIEKADRARDLMDRGYAPLSRFGHYTVDVVDANGERVYFGMFETAREAARMARKMRGNFPDAQVMRGTVSEEEYKLFAGVSPETVELFGELLGLESQGSDEKSQAFQTYIKVAKANRSAMKRLIERKGIAGFSEDVGRVLAGFLYSNARQTSQNLHMGEMTQAATDVSKGEGELKDQATRLVEYVKNPQEEAQAFRGLLFAQYLGGSVASAFVNMLQPVQVTFPYLSQFGGAAKAGQQMARAIADVRKRATGDDALDAALKKAEEEGIVAPQEVHQLMAQARGRGVLKSGDGTPMGNAAAKASNALSRLTLAWGKFFSSAEQFNRRVTFIAAYRTAQEQGIADPAGFAEKAINETQFVYNKGNRPEWARGAIGSTVFVFKQYSISYVELLHRLATQGGPGGKKAALLMLGMLFLMGGAGGLPFAEDLDDLIDGAMQRLGYNFSTKLAKKQFFENLLGKELGRFAEHGLSGLPGVPIDVSGRLGLGNLIPGTGLLVQKQDHTRDVTEIAGVGGDFASRVFKGAEKTLQGDLFGGAKDLAPRAAYNAAKAAEMYSTGIYKDDKGKKVIDVDAWEALAKGIGFQPTTVAVEQERTGLQHKLIGQAKLAESQFADRWAKAVADGNQQDLADVREAIRRYNVKNPATPVRINRSQIARRVKDLRMPKAERVLKAAPREIRETVRRELAPA
jgi:hypothetical protein